MSLWRTCWCSGDRRTYMADTTASRWAKSSRNPHLTCLQAERYSIGPAQHTMLLHKFRRSGRLYTAPISLQNAEHSLCCSGGRRGRVGELVANRVEAVMDDIYWPAALLEVQRLQEQRIRWTWVLAAEDLSLPWAPQTQAQNFQGHKAARSPRSDESTSKPDLQASRTLQRRRVGPEDRYISMSDSTRSADVHGVLSPSSKLSSTRESCANISVLHAEDQILFSHTPSAAALCTATPSLLSQIRMQT